MEILERAKTPTGVDIQIENWHKDYNFIAEASTIATYPRATKTNYNSSLRYPQLDETFRLELRFDNKEQANQCFDNLKNGTKTIKDYYINFYRKEHIDFI